ncbi:3-hydroxybutyryl-CoA dehydrogenase [Candidatus Odyssella thessalonicensis]|uniref:3-hydroxybutyryl-CoA dehydrogenase n=1 Tax=Candidatus Odyssella thessalonicensis TaxID=84647 RepID=UPI000225B466|nr:3-hydroxybutyryl-CoA dehydrogenase [Candidatus Odyssella thessalonicensis]
MVQQVVVLGAGQMGNGIAQVCAQSGYHVTVVDISEQQQAAAQATIAKNLARLVGKGSLTEDDKIATLSRLSFAQAIPHADFDLLIEAVSENVALKAKLLSEASLKLKENAIIASNTSSISLTQLAMVTNRPDRVIGMHFMNPVPVMQLVEVIRSLTTSEATFTVVQQVIEKMGKTMVVSQDAPGFIVNRILMPMINEAIFTLYEGIASPEDIDTAMKLGTNQPMGPLALADLIGLDTCLAIMTVLYEGFSDSKYRPCPLLRNYVNAGWLGRKSGRGFYEYGAK